MKNDLDFKKVSILPMVLFYLFMMGVFIYINYSYVEARRYSTTYYVRNNVVEEVEERKITILENAYTPLIIE